MDPLYLFIAIVWSSAGLGFLMYGRRRRRMVPLFGGILLMVAPYVAGKTLTLSLVSAGIVAAIYLLRNKL